MKINECPFCGEIPSLQKTWNYRHYALAHENRGCVLSNILLKGVTKEKIIKTWNYRHNKERHVYHEKSEA